MRHDQSTGMYIPKQPLKGFEQFSYEMDGSGVTRIFDTATDEKLARMDKADGMWLYAAGVQRLTDFGFVTVVHTLFKSQL